MEQREAVVTRRVTPKVAEIIKAICQMHSLEQSEDIDFLVSEDEQMLRKFDITSRGTFIGEKPISTMIACGNDSITNKKGIILSPFLHESLERSYIKWDPMPHVIADDLTIYCLLVGQGT